MSVKNDRDYIYLIWKDPKTRCNYIVGELSRNGQYEFSYGYEVEEAIENGFSLLIPFDDIHTIYKSDTLFPTFSSRLPDKKRRGIDKILSKYGLQEYNAYELLKESGARLPIDTLQFIDPIFKEQNGKIKREFYVEGVRDNIGCEGKDCNKRVLDIKIKDTLKLEQDLQNTHDKNAVKIIDYRRKPVGYLPRYYSESVSTYLSQGADYKCTVLEANKDQGCQECIKVELEIFVDRKWQKIS